MALPRVGGDLLDFLAGGEVLKRPRPERAVRDG